MTGSNPIKKKFYRLNRFFIFRIFCFPLEAPSYTMSIILNSTVPSVRVTLRLKKFFIQVSFSLLSLFLLCNQVGDKFSFSPTRLPPGLTIYTMNCVADEGNQALQEFLVSCNPKQQHSTALESYLIKPIQRILKYPLLLTQLKVKSGRAGPGLDDQELVNNIFPPCYRT